MDNKDLAPIEIDLGAHRRDEINESFLRMFGSWIETILIAMFGGSSVPLSVKGTKDEISAFARVLSNEKRYMQAFKQYGLDDPKTFKNKTNLDKAVKSFEKTTKLKWPFK